MLSAKKQSTPRADVSERREDFHFHKYKRYDSWIIKSLEVWNVASFLNNADLTKKILIQFISIYNTNLSTAKSYIFAWSASGFKVPIVVVYNKYT